MEKKNMNSRERKIDLDSELKELWSEGLDEAQLSSISKAMQEASEVDPPRGLREKLQRQPKELLGPSSFPWKIFGGIATPIAALLILIVVFPSQQNEQSGVKTNIAASNTNEELAYLSVLDEEDDDFIFDIFDDELSALEELI